MSAHRSALRARQGECPWPVQMVTEPCPVAGLCILQVSHLGSGVPLRWRRALTHKLPHHALGFVPCSVCSTPQAAFCRRQGGCCCSGNAQASSASLARAAGSWRVPLLPWRFPASGKPPVRRELLLRCGSGWIRSSSPQRQASCF